MNTQAQNPAPAAQDDVKIIPPDYTLKKLVGDTVDLKQIFSAENISKAQGVIDTHKESFLEWIKNDMQTLEDQFAQAQANPADSADAIKKLAKAAFIIKSQAGTFGFSLATLVAKSLDDFCNQTFRPSQEHLTVIRKHIDALQVIFHKNIMGDGAQIGKELSGNLQKLVAKYQSAK